MRIYGVLSLSLVLNWLKKIAEFAENRLRIYDHDNCRPWVLLFIILAILLRLGFLHLADKENNSDNNEEEQSLRAGEEELTRGEIVQTSQVEGDEQAGGRTADGGGVVVPRHGGCAFCGGFSTTRCSRCKAARYCSVKCQIGHWRSGHKDECVETETTTIVKKRKKKNSYAIKAVDQKSEVGVIDFSADDFSDAILNNYNRCVVCGNRSTTICSRCKAVKYCSSKCLIEDWTWHKFECLVLKLNPAHPKVGIPKNKSKKEDHIQSASSLLLEFSTEEKTTSTKPLTEGSSVPIKKPQDHTAAEWASLREELAKLRYETKLLKLERNNWVVRANVARERYHSFKKESEYQLLVLKHEEELILNAEKQARNVIDDLSEKLYLLQTELQESIAETMRQEEYIQMLESEWAKTKRDLHEEQRRWPAANVGRPAIVCSICLTNEKDLAFGCGHMTCKDCGSKILKCPICRKQINSRVKLFLG